MGSDFLHLKYYLNRNSRFTNFLPSARNRWLHKICHESSLNRIFSSQRNWDNLFSLEDFSPNMSTFESQIQKNKSKLRSSKNLKLQYYYNTINNYTRMMIVLTLLLYLLDFLHFNQKNPMVPNLSNVFSWKPYEL